MNTITRITSTLTLATGLTLAALTSPAAAEIPLVVDNPVVAASGNRATGFTLTFQSGGAWVTGSFHAELKTCRQDHPRGKDRRKCTAIVRGAMHEYVAIRNAG